MHLNIPDNESCLCSCFHSVFAVFKAAHSPLRFKVFLQEISKAADHSEATLMRQLLVRASPLTSVEIFSAVPMRDPGGGVINVKGGGIEGAETADIRAWYNAVFLPRVEGKLRA